MSAGTSTRKNITYGRKWPPSGCAVLRCAMDWGGSLAPSCLPAARGTAVPLPSPSPPDILFAVAFACFFAAFSPRLRLFASPHPPSPSPSCFAASFSFCASPSSGAGSCVVVLQPLLDSPALFLWCSQQYVAFSSDQSFFLLVRELGLQSKGSDVLVGVHANPLFQQHHRLAASDKPSRGSGCWQSNGDAFSFGAGAGGAAGAAVAGAGAAEGAALS